MPIFATPEPISATIQLQLGSVRITAEPRTDTVVEVRPTSTSSAADRRAAEQTEVRFADGKLLVQTPKQRALFGSGGSVDVLVELPAGSAARATGAKADFRCEGRLGECTLTTSFGDIHVDESGTQRLNTTYGDVTVEHGAGPAEISTGSGRLRVRRLDGSGVVKNSNGDSWVGEVTGDLRVNAANGSIAVDRALGDVSAKTANGDVRIGEVVRGSVELMTAAGELEIGVRKGTAAWLDVRSLAGSIRNSLAAADGPAPPRDDSGPTAHDTDTDTDTDTVTVHARTTVGDIIVRRS